MEVILFYFIFFGFLTLLAFIKKVPSNTTIIIDRNSHFHKKKSFGYYFFNPKTDKITTRISKFPITETYVGTYETHDSYFFTFLYTVTYTAENVDTVLSSLEDSRRSIYDIVNCAFEAAIGSCSYTDLIKANTELHSMIYKELEMMLEPFYIDVTKLVIVNKTAENPEIGKRKKFQKHVSSSDNPIQDY